MTSEGRFCAHFLNEGDGDSIVLQFPDNSLAVVDCCNSVKTHRYLQALGRQLELDEPQLVFVAVTHAHADHDNIGPLIDKLGGGEYVDEVWLSHWPVPRIERLIDYCEQQEIAWLPLDGSGHFPVRQYGDVTVEVLSPRPVGELEEIVNEVKKGTYNWVNESSLVLRLECDGHTLLLTGDAGESNWAYVVYKWQPKRKLQAGAFKVPHHGSRYNLGAGRIASVKPRVAIVSAARRGHGRFKTLPDEEVEQMLARDVHQVYYTYSGSCVLTPHGKEWQVEQLADYSTCDVPSLGSMSLS
jgi:beta-lactamase superfamily II metal-dependent hydrolase